MSTTYILNPYPVTEKETCLCHKCNGLIVWLTSYRTLNRYPVDVKKVGDQMQIARNWFHYCPKEAVAQLQLLPPAPPAQYTPVKPTHKAKQEAMRSFIEQATESQLRQALEVIFNRQTLAEQVSNSTTMDNSIGFSGVDADILSNIYKKSRLYKGLRGRQVDLVRRKMKRYSRQLIDALEKGEWKL